MLTNNLTIAVNEKDVENLFRDKYKVLEDRMRPLVYELGFLMK